MRGKENYKDLSLSPAVICYYEPIKNGSGILQT